MKPIHIDTSPLTNRIFAGHVLKNGRTWAANKQDVTGAACGAVAEHILANGGNATVACNGKPKFEITVRELNGDERTQAAAEAAPTLCRATVRAVLDLMSIEGCDFYFNEINDYGCITMKLFTGRGDAGRFAGEEQTALFLDGVRGTGYYRLNEAGIDRVMELIASKVSDNTRSASDEREGE